MPGTLTHSPADIIRNILINEGVGTDPSDSGSWPIFASSKPDEPENLIASIDSRGDDQGYTMNDGEVQEKEGVTIWVRGTDHQTAYNKAKSIADTLDGLYQYIVTISGTSYLVHCVARQDNPLTPKKELNSERNVFEFGNLVTVRQR